MADFWLFWRFTERKQGKTAADRTMVSIEETIPVPVKTKNVTFESNNNSSSKFKIRKGKQTSLTILQSALSRSDYDPKVCKRMIGLIENYTLSSKTMSKSRWST